MRRTVILATIFAGAFLFQSPIGLALEEQKEEKKLETRPAETQSAGVQTTHCRLKFNLKGWSVFYKSGQGTGTVHCDNGQSAAVKIRAHGGGVTFGKNTISNGHGSFSKVKDIQEIFGAYAVSEAHAGVYGSAAAQAMTKGKVSLALSGTGKGVDLGIAFGQFRISPQKAYQEKDLRD